MRVAVLFVFALVVTMAVVLASCGRSDDTVALRAELADLKTQIAQPMPTSAAVPTELAHEVTVVATAAPPATPTPQPKPTVAPQAAAPTVQQPPAPTPVPSQPCTNIVLQNGNAALTDAQIRNQWAAATASANHRPGEPLLVPGTNLRASTIQNRSTGQITTLEGELTDRNGTLYAVGSCYPEGGFPR
jgi:hypothetical protein